MSVVHDPLKAPAGRIEVKNTTCYMCACRCGIRVTLRDGEIRYIQGNPEHPLNKGVICAKGASGIMKQYSPARLTQPLKRKEGAQRGDAEFEPISWDEAFGIMEERLAHIRATDPKKFALFTGRDQMQALTGLFAKQFGTPNYAAHGGFCSVNMATGMIYTMGGSVNTRDFFHHASLHLMKSMKWIFLVLVFPVPLTLLWLGMNNDNAPLLFGAFIVQYIGLIAERWFFFAQANHPQNLYYQTV